MDRAKATLEVAFQDLVGHYVTKAKVSIPSPFTGTILTSSHSICLDTFRFLYRFYEPRYGKVFYLGLTGHHCTISCVVVPTEQIDYVFSASDLQQTQTQSMLFRNVRTELISHLCSHGHRLPEYLAGATQCMANVQRGELRHMGHLLWNELTGIMKLIDTVPTDSLPYCIVLDSNIGGEMYGPLDRIFPELSDKIIRTIPDTFRFIDHVYESRMCVVRSTSLFVTQNLRDHMIAHFNAMSELAADRSVINTVIGQGTPIIVLGLRVENRTVVDLEDFYINVTRFLLQRLGPILVIVDGHNSLSLTATDVIESNQEWRALTRPVDVERAVVRSLRDNFTNSPVTIVDMVGRSMEQTLLWISKARFFIAPWGTGMAKYCWVCNKPGYVLTTRWNIDNRHDIGIYAEPYSQGAAELRYASDRVITADPEAKILVEVSDWPRPSFENFTVNYEALFDEISDFISTLPN